MMRLTQRYHFKPMLWLVTMMMVLVGLHSTYHTRQSADPRHLLSEDCVIDGRLGLDSLGETSLVLLAAGLACFLSLLCLPILSVVCFVSGPSLWVTSVLPNVFSFAPTHFWIRVILFSLESQLPFSNFRIRISFLRAFATTGFAPANVAIFGALAVMELIYVFLFSTLGTPLLHLHLYKRKRFDLPPDCVTKQVVEALSTICERRPLFGDASILPRGVKSVK